MQKLLFLFVLFWSNGEPFPSASIDWNSYVNVSFFPLTYSRNDWHIYKLTNIPFTPLGQNPALHACCSRCPAFGTATRSSSFRSRSFHDSHPWALRLKQLLGTNKCSLDYFFFFTVQKKQTNQPKNHHHYSKYIADQQEKEYNNLSVLKNDKPLHPVLMPWYPINRSRVVWKTVGSLT